MSFDAVEDLEGGLGDVLSFVDVPEGRWEPGRVAGGAECFAVLVVRGLLLADLRLDRGGATELLGPGDLLRPWPAENELLPFSSGVVVAEAARVALLDGSFPEVLRRWPGVGARLVAQSAVRHRRQAQHRAASQLPRVEDRILALLWLLAERWGRVAHGGVIVPLSLTHELLGRLVGARRPTVTMAIGQLVDDGHIRRRPDRSVVLMPASRRVLVPGDAARSKVVDASLVDVRAPVSLVPTVRTSGAMVPAVERVVAVRASQRAVLEEVHATRRRSEALDRERRRAFARARTVTEDARQVVARSQQRRSALQVLLDG